MCNNHQTSFIERQFPVARVSAESYKERMAGAGSSQTLTGVGKWWGRKPLVLVRACLIGLLMPASETEAQGEAGIDPEEAAAARAERDRAIFLKILTMDDAGLWRRKCKQLDQERLHALLTAEERLRWLCDDAGEPKARWWSGLTQEQRTQVQRLAFERLSYDDKLGYCLRPEQIDGPAPEDWEAINAHLGTEARSLPELIRALGERRFGRRPVVGDPVCGGGSIPFEAARIGCVAHASDLSPVAALLTWGALHLVGGDADTRARVRAIQQAAYQATAQALDAEQLENNARGWRHEQLYYVVEARSPATNLWVPLAPSLVISEKYRVCARLHPDADAKDHYRIDVIENADAATMAQAKRGTLVSGRLMCPETGNGYAIADLRGDRRIDGQIQHGLRLWENADLAPRPEDKLQERLYCVRWALPHLGKLLAAEQVEGADSTTVDDLPITLATRIQGLLDFLDAPAQARVAALRARDWIAEDCALAEAEAELDAAKQAGQPARELTPLRQKVKNCKAVVNGRAAEVARLAAQVPKRVYRAPDADDRAREARALALVREHFEDWQARGYLPSARIPRGYNTDQPIRERGWTHWHHLFTPRQLLMLGTFARAAVAPDPTDALRVSVAALGIGAAVDRLSRLCGADPHVSKGPGSTRNVFFNQALNPQVSFGSRPLVGIREFLCADFTQAPSPIRRRRSR